MGFKWCRVDTRRYSVVIQSMNIMPYNYNHQQKLIDKLIDDNFVID